MAGFSQPSSVYVQQSYQALMGQDTSGNPGLASTLVSRSLVSSAVTQVSGGTDAYGVYLAAGTVLTSLTFRASGATTGVTAWWLSLCNSSYTVVASTADQGASAITGGRRTVALTAPYVVPTSGIYYFTITQIATTPATLNAASTTGAAAGDPPVLNWRVTGIAAIPAVGYTYSGLANTTNTAWMIAT